MPKKLALLALIGFAVGIALGASMLTNTPSILFILLLSAGFFAAWFFSRRDGYLVPALFLLSLALGAGRTALAPRTLPAAFAGLLETKVELTGTVVADPDVRESSQRLTLRVNKGNETTKILAVAERYPQFAYGDDVQVTGILQKPESFETDGGRTFAYDAFLAKDGIFVMVPRAHIEKLGESTSLPVRAQRMLYAEKHRFEGALEDALPEPHASLAEGLIAGGKQGLGKALLDAFTVTGLLPIIVLSGYNVMIIADAILASLRILPRRYALGLAALAILVFVLAAGGGASAARAGLMAGLALFARATRRTYDALRALAAAFVLMLLFNPLLLVSDSGFQFSFAATLGLILASTAFETRLLWVRSLTLREVLATTLAAQLFVLPLLLYQTGNLSLIAVPANLLVLPVVPLAMAASALAGCVALIAPPLATLVGLPAYVLLSYIIGVAQWSARIPFAHLVIPAFSAVVLIPAYAGIAFLVQQLTRHSVKKLN